MTVRTKAELTSQINTLLSDNTAGDISAADVRSVLTDVADSLQFAANSFSGEYDDLGGVPANLISGDPTGITGATLLARVVSISQADYDALPDATKNDATILFAIPAV